MKKRTIILVALLSVTLILEACNLLSHGKEGKTAQNTPPANSTVVNQESLPSSNNSSAVVSQEYIGETKALEIALNHAKVDSTTLLFSKSTLDRDDGRFVYDVEFYAGNKEYDYEIDALSGNILGFDADMEYDYVPAPAPEQPPVPAAEQPSQTPAEQTPQTPVAREPEVKLPVTEQPVAQTVPAPAAKQESPAPAPAPAPSAEVTLESAKQIALSRVPGATDDHIRIKQDYDDGRLVYEGKIIYQQMEYDFEIDGSSGNIREWDAESIYD